MKKALLRILGSVLIVVLLFLLIYAIFFLYHRLKTQDYLFKQCIEKLRSPEFAEQLVFNYEYNNFDKLVSHKDTVIGHDMIMVMKSEANMAEYHNLKVKVDYVIKDDGTYKTESRAYYIETDLKPRSVDTVKFRIYIPKNMVDAQVSSVLCLDGPPEDEELCKDIGGFSKRILSAYFKSLTGSL